MDNAHIIIKDTHRGLLFKDGALVTVLGAGRHELTPRRPFWDRRRQPAVEVTLVDVRERELTIKGQEILTADKVAIRVSIIVKFRVIDAAAAIQKVESYEDRLYSDVQLAARRSLASMTLEEILTNRNRLNEDISRDLKESAAGYGVEIQRADVKDLVFPGNVQEVMNRVLVAERVSKAQLIEAQTKADVARIDALAKAEAKRIEADAAAQAQRAASAAEADAEAARFARRQAEAQAYADHPALLRMLELETLQALGRNANARLHVSMGAEPKT